MFNYSLFKIAAIDQELKNLLKKKAIVNLIEYLDKCGLRTDDDEKEYSKEFIEYLKGFTLKEKSKRIEFLQEQFLQEKPIDQNLFDTLKLYKQITINHYADMLKDAINKIQLKLTETDKKNIE